MEEQETVVQAFTLGQVERLTGVTQNRLRRWDTTGFFAPAYAYENRRSPYSRIYSFQDVVGLRVINVLESDSKLM